MGLLTSLTDLSLYGNNLICEEMPCEVKVAQSFDLSLIGE